MRTTIRLDDQLLAAAKQRAIETRSTLTAVIEDALRTALAMRGGPGRRKRVVLPTFKGKGLKRGVDLDSSAALLELMERGDAPA